MILEAALSITFSSGRFMTTENTTFLGEIFDPPYKDLYSGRSFYVRRTLTLLPSKNRLIGDPKVGYARE